LITAFFVDESVVNNVIGGQDLQSGLYIYPNSIKENVTISVNNFTGNIKTEGYDLIGNRL
jgi:hypothetical protein